MEEKNEIKEDIWAEYLETDGCVIRLKVAIKEPIIVSLYQIPFTLYLSQFIFILIISQPISRFISGVT